MPLLYVSARSPFGRRVRLAARRTGYQHTEELIDVFNPTPAYLAKNPLGTIPFLSLDEKGALVDSHAILEWIHEDARARNMPGVWPDAKNENQRVRFATELAVGVMTNTVNWFVEGNRGFPRDDWAKDYIDSIERTLQWANTHGVLTDRSGSLNQAGWDFAVALEYMELRIPELKWRDKFHALVSLMESAEKDVDFQKTKPPAA